jgi:hypothetical protein
MNPRSYAHLTFDKVVKNIQWRKNSLFNQCSWEKWLSVYRKLKLDPCLSSCTSIKLKWIKNLDIRLEILQLVHKKAGNTLEKTGVGKNFFSRTQVAQQ